VSWQSSFISREVVWRFPLTPLQCLFKGGFMLPLHQSFSESDPAFVSTGFRNWKAIEKFSVHAKSHSHCSYSECTIIKPCGLKVIYCFRQTTGSKTLSTEDCRFSAELRKKGWGFKRSWGRTQKYVPTFKKTQQKISFSQLVKDNHDYTSSKIRNAIRNLMSNDIIRLANTSDHFRLVSFP
jgi:hypothetical protein